MPITFNAPGIGNTPSPFRETPDNIFHPLKSATDEAGRAQMAQAKALTEVGRDITHAAREVGDTLQRIRNQEEANALVEGRLKAKNDLQALYDEHQQGLDGKNGQERMESFQTKATEKVGEILQTMPTDHARNLFDLESQGYQQDYSRALMKEGQKKFVEHSQTLFDADMAGQVSKAISSKDWGQLQGLLDAGRARIAQEAKGVWMTETQADDYVNKFERNTTYLFVQGQLSDKSTERSAVAKIREGAYAHLFDPDQQVRLQHSVDAKEKEWVQEARAARSEARQIQHQRESDMLGQISLAAMTGKAPSEDEIRSNSILSPAAKAQAIGIVRGKAESVPLSVSEPFYKAMLNGNALEAKRIVADAMENGTLAAHKAFQLSGVADSNIVRDPKFKESMDILRDVFTAKDFSSKLGDESNKSVMAQAAINQIIGAVQSGKPIEDAVREATLTHHPAFKPAESAQLQNSKLQIPVMPQTEAEVLPLFQKLMEAEANGSLKGAKAGGKKWGDMSAAYRQDFQQLQGVLEQIQERNRILNRVTSNVAKTMGQGK